MHTWETVGALREGERDLLSPPSSPERAKAGHLPADAGRAPITSGEGGRRQAEQHREREEGVSGRESPARRVSERKHGMRERWAESV